MITKRIITLLLLLCFIGGAANVFAQTHYVEIKVSGAVNGRMKIMLYDDCPRTTAEFIKKVKEGYYDDTLFGRVIQGFMIQGGAPDSRTAGPGQSIGWGDVDEEIPGEIRRNHIPKKGALAAPHRTNDKEKHSDMSMFFIVQGYPKSLDYWKKMEKTANAESRARAKKQVMNPVMMDSLKMLKTRMDSLNLINEIAEANEVGAQYNALARSLNHKVDSVARANPDTRYYTDAELQAYSTVGGSPHLYMDFTIYGEVVEGLEIIDKIAALETNRYDRPREDVRMKVRVLK